jgi:RimJ/RimL family protein N-acetyltransferase
MGWVALEPLTRDERIALIGGWHAESVRGDDMVYGVFLDGSPIGGTGLHRRLGPTTLEIGYWIHVNHTRQGYATELARGLTDAAFAHPGIDTVEIHHDEANAESAGVPKKLGFTLARKTQREPTAPAETGVEWQWTMAKRDWA